MKRYLLKESLAVLFTIVLFSGCFDLEHDEYGNISSDNFPATQADLDAAVVGVYRDLGNSYIKGSLDYSGFTLNELCTDEMNTGWTGNWQIINTFAWAANAGRMDVYNDYMKAITKTTRVIDAFANSDMNETEKTGIMSELRVLRAFYANAAYSLFGPLAIVTDPAVATNVYAEYKPSRPTREAYINFMITELEESYGVLDDRVSSENWGRMDKGAALTLLMKIYLDAKMFDKANQTADKIIALGKYDLLPVYKDVFDITNEGADNKEVIFTIGRLAVGAAWTYFACVMPSTPAYKTESGKTLTVWGGLKMPWEFYDKYEPQDERLNTIVRYYTDVNDKQVDFRTVADSKATGAIPMKYSEDPDHQGSSQGNDFIVFRYADVLLSKAEALNELNGPSGESIELINKVRRRAKATEISLAGYSGKDALRDFILEERGRELYNEGHRRNDLIRHGKFIQRAIDRGIDAEPYHVLYPIPQAAINENPNLVQNPGYEN